MRVGLIQLCSSDEPAANLIETRRLVREASRQGAEFILTPEVTNCVSSNRARQAEILTAEDEDITLAGLRDEARALGRWLLIGSILVKTGGADGRFANRSFLIGPDGAIVARYDKIHLFDVAISATETYRESSAIRPGDRAVVADTPFGRVGLTVCYDLRFPHLHRRLAQAGAAIITQPAAFSRATGVAHWEVLLRARAIETGCFVLAPAQTGQHPNADGNTRTTWGHSLVVAPWGEVLLDAGTEPGAYLADIDLAAVADARRRVPSLSHDRDFEGPA